MKKTILTILLAAWALGAWAQPRALTLDDCRALAVANNAGVKIAEGKAEAATELKREAFTKYFPTIQAQAIGFRSNTEVFKYDVGNLFTLGLVKKGGSLNVTAVQPVFAGGRIANGNKLAKVGVAVADLEHEGAIDNALLTVEQYYWQVATLQSKKRTLQAVIQMLDTLDRQVSVAVEAGVVNRNDLLKVQLQRNNMLSLMVDLDNGIALSSNLLAQYVGLDGQEVAIVDDAPPAEVPVLPADLYLDPSQALGSTVDYRLLEQSVRAADLEKSITVGQYLPTIGIGAGYFYDDLLNQNHGFAAGFVSVSVPISGWWGGAHDIKRKSIQASNARMQMTDLSQMLQLKMTDAYDNLTAAHRKMSIASQSIDQSKENLRLNQNYYDAGVSSVTDLLDAQTLYRHAQDQYAESYGAYRTALAAYLAATGRINN